MIQEVIDRLVILLEGRIPDKLTVGEDAAPQEHRLAELLNELFTSVQETHEFILPLSKGKLDELRLPPARNFLGSPFKELHSRLLHLTWQAKQVAYGDYSQRIDFMGDFSEALNFMIVSLDHNERILKKKIDELEKAVSHITQLEGILPICSNCKKIRLEGAEPKNLERWMEIESYISRKTVTQFSHSICPACLKELYPDFDE